MTSIPRIAARSPPGVDVLTELDLLSQTEATDMVKKVNSVENELEGIKMRAGQ